MRELEPDRRQWMIGAREVELRVADRRAVAVADEVPVERVGPLTDEGSSFFSTPSGVYTGRPLHVEAVLVHHVQAVDVDAMVGVRVRDHNRGEVDRVRVLLQVRERAVAAVHPDRLRRPPE